MLGEEERRRGAKWGEGWRLRGDVKGGGGRTFRVIIICDGERDYIARIV